ncbi:MAG: hypothetical protein M1497_08400, partial [Nitrospirae bacterium]|nr:hypothetical protein [Nitrospirota bacterium]
MAMHEQGRERMLEILTTAGLLSREQTQFIRSREAPQRAKILRAKGGDIRYKSIHRSFISFIDVIESLQIPCTLPGRKILTAEVMMEAIARHLNLPFVKIDPLKLDSDVVTRIISKP